MKVGWIKSVSNPCKTTYYVLDHSGNVLSVYEHEVNTTANTIAYKQTERFIYGSDRVGVLNKDVNLLGFASSPSSQNKWTHEVGKRSYELKNHLGNVLSVISNKVIPHNSGGVVDYYIADVLESQDFSGFGVVLKNRGGKKAGITDIYRMSFQGQEHDNEIKGDGNSVNYEYRMHDPRLGRFFAIDPIAEDFPWNSTYAFSENRLVDGVELEGLEFESRTNANGETVWWISDVISEGLDWVPVVGNLKGVLEAIDGERAFTGDPLSPMERTLSVVTIIPGGNYVKKLDKVNDAVKLVDKASDAKKTLKTVGKKEASDQVQKKVLTYSERMANLKKMNYSKNTDGTWSATNYRNNLKKHTGKLADGFDAHHTLPKSKEFAEYFKKAGLDVNDPKNLLWRDAKQHRGTNSTQHLQLWRDYMKKNPKATKEQILKQRDIIENKVWGNTKGDTPVK